MRVGGAETIDRAEQACNDAFTRYDARDDYLGQAIALINLGILAHQKQDLLGAQERYEHAQAILDDIPFPHAKAALLNDLGLLLRAQKRYREAAETLQEARETSARLGNRLERARATNNLGLVFVDCSDLEHARELLNRAATIIAELGALADEKIIEGNIESLDAVKRAEQAPSGSDCPSPDEFPV